eukprot:m.169872 g.169872  ORF g.169872 m.169872 type:complete len:877 (+) comp16674_c0_seq1:186-2816(+)
MEPTDAKVLAARANRIKEARAKYASDQRANKKPAKPSAASSEVRSESVAMVVPRKKQPSAQRKAATLKPPSRQKKPSTASKSATLPRNPRSPTRSPRSPKKPGPRTTSSKSPASKRGSVAKSTTASSSSSASVSKSPTRPIKREKPSSSRGRGKVTARGRGRGRGGSLKQPKKSLQHPDTTSAFEDHASSSATPSPRASPKPNRASRGSPKPNRAALSPRQTSPKLVEATFAPSPPPRHQQQPSDPSPAPVSASKPRPPPPTHHHPIPVVSQATYETPVRPADAVDFGQPLQSELVPHVVVQSVEDTVPVVTQDDYAEIDPNYVPDPSLDSPEYETPAVSPRRKKGLFARFHIKRKSSETVVGSPGQSPVSSRRGTDSSVILEGAVPVPQPVYATIPGGDVGPPQQQAPPVVPPPYISNGTSRHSSAADLTHASRDVAVSDPYLSPNQHINMPANLLAAADSTPNVTSAPGPVAPPRPASTFQGAELERVHSAIATYLEQLESWLIPYEQLEVSSVELGKGQFGCVKEATLVTPEYKQLVAIKTPGASHGENLSSREELLREATMMAVLSEDKHVNVLALLGVVNHPKVEGGLCLLMDHCGRGDLRSLLLNHAPRGKSQYKLSVGELISFSGQIAAGMSYLAEKNIVHRDLAARNVLVDNQYVAKVADYGLARQENYTAENTRALPFRWMSPEALQTHVFSTTSDVWSYGITLYEIFTFGGIPYPGLSSHPEVVRYLKQREPPMPADAPDTVKPIVRACWNPDPNQRPTFEELYRQMTEAYEHLKGPGKKRHWKHRLRRILGQKVVPKLDMMTDAALLDMCKEGVITADEVMELQHRYGEGNLKLRDEELSLTSTDKAYRLIQRFQTMQAEEQSSV